MQFSMRDLATNKNQTDWVERLAMNDLLTARNDIVHTEPLQIRLQATYDNGVVMVAGDLKLSVEFVCSKCLAQYCQELHVPFREGFTQALEKADEENDEIHHVSEDKVDIIPYVVENVMLGIPYVPVCKEDCKGLSVSGLNQNIYPAEEKQDIIDPRMAALADFFNKDKS